MFSRRTPRHFSHAAHRRIAALVVAAIAASGLVATEQAAQAAALRNPYTTLSVETSYDGTGHGTAAQTFINSRNTAASFAVKDDDPHDGIVASGDTVNFATKIQFDSNIERTIEVRYPEPANFYLTLVKDSFCVSGRFVTATKQGNTCVFQVPRSASELAVGRSRINTAKDTSARVVTDQRLTFDIGYPTETYRQVQTPPITVVSAPSADVVLSSPPMTQIQNSAAAPVVIRTQGKSAWTLASFNGSFRATPVRLKYQGFSANGASVLLPWWGQFDVSGMPAGTSYGVVGTDADGNRYGQNPRPVGGMLTIPESIGEVQINYTVPAGGFGDLEVATGMDYPVRVLVDPQSFTANGGSMKNQGTGGQPGDGLGKDAPTRNDGIAAVNGSPYLNNDWTALSIYRPYVPDGDVWNKAIYAPNTTGATIWSPGNMHYAQAANGERRAEAQFTDVAPGSEVTSRLLAALQNATNPGAGARVIIGDRWDIADLTFDTGASSGRVIEVISGTVAIDPDLYTIQYSVDAKTPEQVGTLTDPGWITGYPTDAAQAVRVVFAPDALGFGRGTSSAAAADVGDTELQELDDGSASAAPKDEESEPINQGDAGAEQLALTSGVETSDNATLIDEAEPEVAEAITALAEAITAPDLGVEPAELETEFDPAPETGLDVIIPDANTPDPDADADFDTSAPLAAPVTTAAALPADYLIVRVPGIIVNPAESIRGKVVQNVLGGSIWYNGQGSTTEWPAAVTVNDPPDPALAAVVSAPSLTTAGSTNAPITNPETASIGDTVTYQIKSSVSGVAFFGPFLTPVIEVAVDPCLINITPASAVVSQGSGCGLAQDDPNWVPTIVRFVLTDYTPTGNGYNGDADFPPVTFSATVSKSAPVATALVVTAKVSLDLPNDGPDPVIDQPDPAPSTGSKSLAVQFRKTVAAKQSQTPPKIEVGDSFAYRADAYSWGENDAVIDSTGIIILPKNYDTSSNATDPFYVSGVGWEVDPNLAKGSIYSGDLWLDSLTLNDAELLNTTVWYTANEICSYDDVDGTLVSGSADSGQMVYQVAGCETGDPARQITWKIVDPNTPVAGPLHVGTDITALMVLSASKTDEPFLNGISLNFNTLDNRVGDSYVVWMGMYYNDHETHGVDGFTAIQPEATIALMPGETETVASTISGRLAWDDNYNGQYDCTASSAAATATISGADTQSADEATVPAPVRADTQPIAERAPVSADTPGGETALEGLTALNDALRYAAVGVSTPKDDPNGESPAHSGPVTFTELVAGQGDGEPLSVELTPVGQTTSSNPPNPASGDGIIPAGDGILPVKVTLPGDVAPDITPSPGDIAITETTSLEDGGSDEPTLPDASAENTSDEIEVAAAAVDPDCEGKIADVWVALYFANPDGTKGAPVIQNGTALRVQTDANGHYEFTNLRHGDYVVEPELNLPGVNTDYGFESVVQTYSTAYRGTLATGLVFAHQFASANPAELITLGLSDALVVDFGWYRPDQSQVLSSIDGFLWWDGNQDAFRDDDESPIAGVNVTLIRLDPATGLPSTDFPCNTAACVTTTDAAGYYEFTNLNTGLYATTVSRDTRSVSYDQADTLVSDGKLAAGISSYYGNTAPNITNTYSYRNVYEGANDTSTPISLTINRFIHDVDFGYYQGNALISLDKNLEYVTCDGGFCEVGWDVTVANRSDTAVNDLHFYDRLTGGFTAFTVQGDEYEPPEPHQFSNNKTVFTSQMPSGQSQLRINRTGLSTTSNPAIIDWGDNSPVSTDYGNARHNVAHTYATAGQYTVTITGGHIGVFDQTNSNFRNGLIRIESLSDEITDLSYFFYSNQSNNYCLPSGTTASIGLHCLDNNVDALAGLSTYKGTPTNMSYMFAQTFYGGTLPAGYTLGISGIDTSKVTNMSYMFNKTFSLTASSLPAGFNLGIGGLDTSKVTNMSNMFASTFMTCETASSVPCMPTVTGSLPAGFTLDVGRWNTGSVQDMSQMFYQTFYRGTTLPAGFTLDVTGWNTSNVTNMSEMFSGTFSSGTLPDGFTLDVSGWNTSKVTNMSSLFASTFYGVAVPAGLALDVGGWNTGNATVMTQMFQGTFGTVTLPTGWLMSDLSCWNVTKITSAPSDFRTNFSANGTNGISAFPTAYEPRWGTNPACAASASAILDQPVAAAAFTALDATDDDAPDGLPYLDPNAEATLPATDGDPGFTTREFVFNYLPPNMQTTIHIVAVYPQNAYAQGSRGVLNQAWLDSAQTPYAYRSGATSCLATGTTAGSMVSILPTNPLCGPPFSVLNEPALSATLNGAQVTLKASNVNYGTNTNGSFVLAASDTQIQVTTLAGDVVSGYDGLNFPAAGLTLQASSFSGDPAGTYIVSLIQSGYVIAVTEFNTGGAGLPAQVAKAAGTKLFTSVGLDQPTYNGCNSDADYQQTPVWYVAPGMTSVKTEDACDITPAVFPPATTDVLFDGSLVGTVWQDDNRNGWSSVIDDGDHIGSYSEDNEAGRFSGLLVQLYNGAGALLATTTTDANGDYAFTGLVGGSYSVAVQTPGSPWLPSTDTVSDALSVPAGGTTRFDVGLYSLLPNCTQNVCIPPTTELSVAKGRVVDSEEPSGAVAAVDLAAEPDAILAGSTNTIVAVITNTGEEPLVGLTFSDETIAGADVTDWVCDPDLTDLVLAPGDSTTCTGTLLAPGSNGTHEDLVTVSGIGQLTGTDTTANDGYLVAVQMIADLRIEVLDVADRTPLSGATVTVAGNGAEPDALPVGPDAWDYPVPDGYYIIKQDSPPDGYLPVGHVADGTDVLDIAAGADAVEVFVRVRNGNVDICGDPQAQWQQQLADGAGDGCSAGGWRTQWDNTITILDSYIAPISHFIYEIHKVDGADVDLPGAAFELYADADLTEPVYVSQNAIGDGTQTSAVSWNVELVAGNTYYLLETKAPAGYHLLPKPIEITMDADGNVTTDAPSYVCVAGLLVGSEDECPGTPLEDSFEYPSGFSGTVFVRNYRSLGLPYAGGNGYPWWLIAPVVIAAVGGVILQTRRRVGQA